jgi:hypothetical protein
MATSSCCLSEGLTVHIFQDGFGSGADSYIRSLTVGIDPRLTSSIEKHGDGWVEISSRRILPKRVPDPLFGSEASVAIDERENMFTLTPQRAGGPKRCEDCHSPHLDSGERPHTRSEGKQ